jgi:thiosulfate dehydrogenase
MLRPLPFLFGLLVCLGGCVACGPSTRPAAGAFRYELSGPLIPSRMTMVTAWDVPQNPLTDATLDDSPLSRDIRWGYRIFTDTPGEAARFAPGQLSCNNCHLNGGQREKALPLVGVTSLYPVSDPQEGRSFSLADRIVECFLRNENATGHAETAASGPAEATRPTPAAREVLALSAYLTWISRGIRTGESPAWLRQNTIAPANQLPPESLDVSRGEALFLQKCTNCHGPDGQGVLVEGKRPGPLWGPGSWNDGAGTARVHVLAGLIRYTMPFLDPGSLTDNDAQHLAAFINAKPRPAYPFDDREDHAPF